MDDGNRHCKQCGLRLAEVFCACTDPETFLCGQCLFEHSKKKSSKGHPTWPISDFLGYKNPQYFQRQEALLVIQAHARQAVTDVDQAINQYRTLVDAVLQEIWASAQETVDKLTNIKAQLSADIEEALEEVQRTLADPKPMLRSKYGQAFRALVQNPEPFQLFGFTAPSCPVSAKSLLTLEFNLCLPEHLYKPAPFQLPQIDFLSEHGTPEVAEAHYLESIRILAAHFPESLQFAICQHNLGNLYKSMLRLDQAETYLLQAISLCKARFPQDLSFARCLNSLGDLYRHMKKYAESEAQYQLALTICAVHFPQDLGHAICLGSLGLLYKEMQHREQAETYLLQAISLYKARFPRDLGLARCLNSLGNLYMQMKKYAESEAQLQLAFTIFAAHFPQDLVHAICLGSLGNLYKEMQWYEQSEYWYLQASQVYQTHFTAHISYATNLSSLAGLYEMTGRKNEAVAMLQTAISIYDHNRDQPNAARCRNNLQRLAK